MDYYYLELRPESPHQKPFLSLPYHPDGCYKKPGKDTILIRLLNPKYSIQASNREEAQELYDSLRCM